MGRGFHAVTGTLLNPIALVLTPVKSKGGGETLCRARGPQGIITSEVELHKTQTSAILYGRPRKDARTTGTWRMTCADASYFLGHDLKSVSPACLAMPWSGNLSSAVAVVGLVGGKQQGRCRTYWDRSMFVQIFSRRLCQ